jgi:uncharacterized protein
MLKRLTTQVVFAAALAVSASAHAGSYDDFFTAITRDNPVEIAELLKRGFDVNSLSTKGQHGLFEALQKDSQKAAAALLESEALDVNALNDKGESVLMIAALKGKVEMCELLLKRGAKVNKEGWTPLHYAATGPEPKTVALLLAQGADLKRVNAGGWNAVELAANVGREVLSKRLAAVAAK